MKYKPVRLALKPNLRQIDYIIIHSTATKQGKPLTAQDIDSIHKDKGFAGIGYNIVVDLDGRVELGRSLVWQGAHCKNGRNIDSIGVCYVGGVDANGEPSDTRTPLQHLALEAVLQTLKAVWPDAQICGHRDFANTECPSFNAKKYYEHITGDTIF